MSFSYDLLKHAFDLLGKPPTTPNEAEVNWRRAVSASYYALFHHISQAVADQIAPQASPKSENRIRRWLNHSDVKKICREFAGSNPKPPLSDLLDGGVSVDMQTVAVSFIDLQEARHRADYDLAYQLTFVEARDLIVSAGSAIEAWDKIKHTAEANIFILSLVLWKNWEDKNRK